MRQVRVAELTTQRAEHETTATSSQSLDEYRWHVAARGENSIQRLDRHYMELLQEMRVVQTGVQILFAFLLGFAFTSRFPTLTTTQRGVYLVTLVLAAVTAGLLIAPVSHHRLLYRRQLRLRIVETAHRLVSAGLFCLLLTLLGAVQLAATLVIGGWAVVLVAVMALGIGGLWWGVPLWQRATCTRTGAVFGVPPEQRPGFAPARPGLARDEHSAP